MNRILALFGLIIFIHFGCENKKVELLENKPYIVSYELLDDKCTDAIKDILAPSGLEKENHKISEIYRLDVKLDSTIYYNTLYNKNFFIGIILKTKENKETVQFFHIIPQDGIITQCEVIENNTKLIVKNIVEFQNNANGLGSNNCFGLDTTIRFRHIKPDEVGFWEVISSSTFYGKWQFKKDNYYIFNNEIYSNYWNFKENAIYLTNYNNDTVLKSSYKIEDKFLIIESIPDTFLIKTQTNTCIILGKNKTDSINYLYKINDNEEIK